MRAGAWGHILKTMHPREIVNSIRQVHAGQKTFPHSGISGPAPRAANRQSKTRRTEISAKGTGGKLDCAAALRQRNADGGMRCHLEEFMQKIGADGETVALNTETGRGFMRL
jgi:DNA-binding NarL/FixJ family response regulator